MSYRPWEEERYEVGWPNEPAFHRAGLAAEARRNKKWTIIYDRRREEYEVYGEGEYIGTYPKNREDEMNAAIRRADEEIQRDKARLARQTAELSHAPSKVQQQPTRQSVRLRRFLIVVGLVFVIALGSIILVLIFHSHDLLYTYTRHSDSVNAVAWSPDGKLIASASNDKTVQVWNATTGKTLVTYTGHSTAVLILAWSPNGKYIASLGLDGIEVWTANDGKSIFTFAPVTAISWSPDSKYLAFGRSVGIVEVVKLDNDNTIDSPFENGSINSVAWSPDGKYIAYGGNDGTVKIWDPNTNKTIQTIPVTSKGNKILSIAWSPDSKTIAIGDEHGNAVCCIPEQEIRGYTIAGKNLFRYGSVTGSSIAWSPDGKFIAFISNTGNSIEVHKIADSSSIATYNVTGARDVAWSPDGTRIATSGIDDTVQVWQAPSA